MKKARRRIYPPSYKARFLKEYESLPARERAALLRREGLYCSHVISWRRTFAKRWRGRPRYLTRAKAQPYSQGAWGPE
ncbi:hypothetical protein [Ferrithrix thermotolerans]|uniref:hypothetical protein n=1 Tax=Ferrithrix thermotolerans TaxID=209649 RepID=UPI000934201D|nr:hypothetical protein [Ferrithrix thermotolerans]